MDPHEQERAISDLEKRIDRLRALYDMYFMGIEKLEPTVPRKEVERLVATLRKEGMRNTAQRFRFQQQAQRYSTLLTYWGRIARQIEEGTYRRDVMRAKARVEAAGGGATGLDDREDVEQGAPVHEVDLSDFDAGDDEERTDPNMETVPPQAPPPSPPPGSPQPSMAELLGERRVVPPPRPPPVPLRPRTVAAPAARPDSLSTERMQDIYRRFVAAREQCNESVKGLSFEKVREQLRSREASLAQKHGKAVDFEVTIKGGKAVLRAVPRDS